MARNFKENLLEKFKDFESGLNGQKDSSIHTERKNAIDEFQKFGLPTVKNEKWKYTNVGFLNKFNFDIDFKIPQTDLTKKDIEEYLIEGLNANVVVLINGFYSDELSNIVDNNLEIKSLRKAFDENTNDIENHYNKYLKDNKNVFSSLNTALSQDGLFIKVPKSTTIENPIQIVSFVQTQETEKLVQPRNLFIIEENAEAKIYESNHTLGQKVGVLNLTTEIYQGVKSRLEYIKFQNDSDKGVQFNQTEVHQEKESNYTNHTITINGKFIRNDSNHYLNDEYIESNLFGYFHMSDRNFVDNHTIVDHAEPNCNSNELYKGVLDDKAIGVFNGRILVRQDAQKTNAYQSSKCILLSEHAKINAKPELEIYADDVKCSHGASTGKIEPEELFYLQSRGIEKDTARSLLLNAYAQDVIQKISIEAVKNHIAKKVEERLGIDV